MTEYIHTYTHGGRSGIENLDEILKDIFSVENVNIRIDYGKN
jgi:hypothetical protein